jgi:AcrR family transcriptional regulator
MPKIIDHDERRRALAEGVWRVIARDGVAAASVRTVAAEVGLSTGSLRHSFPAHADLLVYAMHLVVERIESRVARAATTTGRRAVEQRLQQLLPLDDERRIENEVWLAFTAAALVSPGLREVWDEVHRAQRRACTLAVTQLGAGDVDIEASRLHAVLDGLAVHAALSRDDARPDHLTATLRRHLDSVETGGRRRGRPRSHEDSAD